MGTYSKILYFLKYQLTDSINHYFKDLRDFKISFDNPVFGLIILIALFMLFRFWGLKKAFSYCLLVSLILVFSSKAIMRLNIIMPSDSFFRADIAKGITIFIVILVSLYYAAIKSD